MADTSRIHSLVGQARRRLKLQSALEAAVLAVIPAVACAALAIYLVRVGAVGEEIGIALLAGCAGLVLCGALVGWMRSFSTEFVATRVDRASGLADRLANACAFEETLRRGGEAVPGDEHEETRALMEAAIDDAVRAAPRADVKRATPFAWPRDIRPALAFTGFAALVSGLYIAPRPIDPTIASVDPPAAPRRAEIQVHGTRFGEGETGVLLLGEGDSALRVTIVDWQPDRVRAIIPEGAAVGRTVLVVRSGERTSAPVPFEILPDGVRHRDRDEPVALADEDLDYTRDLLGELVQTAEANQDPELKELAGEIKELLDQAERGEITKEELLDRVGKAHEKYTQGTSEKMNQEAVSDLEKTGRELAKNKLTKDIGEALAKGDLETAQQEMQKLAKKLANGEVSDKQAQEAAKSLEKAAKAFEKRQAERETQAEKKTAQAEKEMRDLQKKMADSKSPEEKSRFEKKLDDKKRELKRLQREKEEQQASNEKRNLKRLHRNMQQASDQMKQQGQESRRTASRTMEDMAQNTGKVDADKRKMTNQKKVASQLDDLKEAMRRAKRGGSRGPEDRFGRNKKDGDFARRARGQGTKPGQGQPGGPGQGNQPGGQGNQPGGSSYGDGHDPDLLGDPTARSKQGVNDEGVSGIHGKGPSTRETIRSSAQKGFASQSYRQVYGRYKAIVEEVINAEKVPSGYRYYVKKYFQTIKPHAM